MTSPLPPPARKGRSRNKAGLRCPECGDEMSIVTNSRPTSNFVRRRRQCLGSGYTYSTTEMRLEDFQWYEKLEKTLNALAEVLK